MATAVKDRDFPAEIDFSEYEDDDEEQSDEVVPDEWHDNLKVVRPTLEEIVATSPLAQAWEMRMPNQIAAAPNVKFPRALLPGMEGWDVRGHKRAWSRAFPDLYPWPGGNNHFTDFFGQQFKAAVIKGQKRMGILATGKIGVKTHEALERHHRKGYPKQWAFDDNAIQLCADYAAQYYKTPEEVIREHMLAAWEYWLTLNALENYAQYRPYHLVKPPQYSKSFDCSVFYTMGCYAGGAPDPNRFNYNGLGYTETLRYGTAKCSIYDLEPGDPVFYGFSYARPGFPAGSPSHVAGYGGIQYSPERGTKVRVIYTMGSSRDPRKRPMDYRHDVNEYAKLKTAA